MGVNWKEMENVLRLYAADMAVNGAKGRDYKTMAAYFGKGTSTRATYDTIEGKCRSIRKIAATLEEEFNKKNGKASPPTNDNDNANASQASIASTTTTPKKAKSARNPTTTPRGKKNGTAEGEKVLSGRVVKNARKSKEDAKGKMIKQEEDSGANADLDMDAEGVAEGLGLDENFDFLRMEMEV
ncbi:MAG: hypothetical protein Q9183_004975 [Haloplaca sp. 2 TL-2023]